MTDTATKIVKRNSTILLDKAEAILDRCLTQGWTPTTADMQEAYGLDDAQMQTVKKYCKKLAADKSMVWGYHPQSNYFRFVPPGNHRIAYEILGFAFDSWANAGRSTEHLLRGAGNEGFIDQDLAEKAQTEVKSLSKQIEKLGKLVVVPHGE